MKIKADLEWKGSGLPRLSLFIRGGPHRRQHRAVFTVYRKALLDACKDLGVKLPITRKIALYVIFLDNTCPDLGSLYLALETCLDGKSHPAVLKDDSLIRRVDMMFMD